MGVWMICVWMFTFLDITKESMTLKCFVPVQKIISYILLHSISSNQKKGFKENWHLLSVYHNACIQLFSQIRLSISDITDECIVNYVNLNWLSSNFRIHVIAALMPWLLRELCYCLEYTICITINTLNEVKCITHQCLCFSLATCAYLKPYMKWSFGILPK